jgi:hypothetical protein
MDTESLLSIKSLVECNIFDEPILNNIQSFFKESNIKYVKKNKKLNNVLKNSNFNLKKNTIGNKIIFILNKLSETNIDNIVIEFIQNIKVDSIDTFNIVIENIFQKILKDSKFIDIYCDFFIKIIKYNYKKYSYEPFYLFVLFDNFIKDYNTKPENERIIFLNFLISIEENGFFNKEMIEYIRNIITNLKLIPDIKHWYYHYNLDTSVLKGFNIENTRDKLIYESIFENKNINNNCNNNSNNNNNIKKDTIDIFKTQCENIIEEYNYMNLDEEIIYFIETECDDNNKKSKFFEYLINNYISNKNESVKLFELIIKSNKNIFRKTLNNFMNNNLSSQKRVKLKNICNLVKDCCINI